MRYETKIGSGFRRWSEGTYSPGQLEAFNDFTSSFILLSGAYRSGKTEIGARAALRHAYFFPGAKVGIFRQHLASLRRSTLGSVLELLHPSWIGDWSNTQLECRLKNGSSIAFIGADYSDRLGSIELSMAFIDEAHELSEESLGMIQGRLSGTLRLPRNIDDYPSTSRPTSYKPWSYDRPGWPATQSPLATTSIGTSSTSPSRVIRSTTAIPSATQTCQRSTW